MTGLDFTAFVIGFGSGAVVFWQVSKVVERFRRARRDFRAAKRGMRTLVEMMLRGGWHAAKGSAVGAGIVAVAFFAWYLNRSH